MNWLLLPTLALSVLLFACGQAAWGRASSRAAKALLVSEAAVLAAPALLYCLYYLHLFDDWAAFIELRSAPFTEFLAAGCGLAAGLASAIAVKWHKLARPLIIGLMFAGIALPYMKPLLAPRPQSAYRDIWVDGACLQSTSSSCGPACAASILAQEGIPATEMEIAKAAFTYQGGTESWHLVRAIRSKGLKASVITRRPSALGLPAPSIAGVRMGGVGHFIAILEETPDAYVTADPLVGKRTIGKSEIRKRYEFTGFFVKIEPNGNATLKTQ